MKKRVYVVIGGPSAEYEVSLKTGYEILTHLDKNKYDAKAVFITQSKEFYYSKEYNASIVPEDFDNPENCGKFFGPLSPMASQEIWKECDIAYLALHGEFGEDGKFQGYLDTLGIPYTGSGVFASANGLNKIMSQKIFALHGITVPQSFIYSRTTPSSVSEIEQAVGYPCFVKCPQSGSSRLMGRAANSEELQALLDEFTPHSEEILIEEYIEGDEYTCPVLEYSAHNPKVLAPILIRPVNSSFFDFTAKYTASECEEIVPAPCSEELTEKIQQIALKAHQILGCEGVTRTDMIERDGTLYTLEINTLPGMTSNSLVPKAFNATGGTFSELLDIMIATALEEAK